MASVWYKNLLVRPQTEKDTLEMVKLTWQIQATSGANLLGMIVYIQRYSGEGARPKN